MPAELDKYRWYQTSEEVIVEVPLKKISAEDVTVNFGADIVTLSARLHNDEVYWVNLNLRDNVQADQCSFRVHPMKIELRLPKSIQCQWRSLEKEDDLKSNPSVSLKNWDRFLRENWTEKDELTSMETVLAKLYADSDDEQRKAMTKSFTESCGTVLSTDWKEVSQQKVEAQPYD